MFADPATRKDQVDAVSEDGKDIGKATGGSPLFSKYEMRLGDDGMMMMMLLLMMMMIKMMLMVIGMMMMMMMRMMFIESDYGNDQ